MAACAAAFAAARRAASAAWAALAAPPTAPAMAGEAGSAQATFPSAICLSRARSPRLASPEYKIASSPAAWASPPNAALAVSTGPAERAMAFSLAATSLTLAGSAVRQRVPNNALSLRSAPLAPSLPRYAVTMPRRGRDTHNPCLRRLSGMQQALQR
jgi:hypothetical protein